MKNNSLTKRRKQNLWNCCDTNMEILEIQSIKRNKVQKGEKLKKMNLGKALLFYVTL